MESQGNKTHTILNILAQVKETRLSVGTFDGYAISKRQVVAIEEALEELISVNTPEASEAGGEEDSLRVRRVQVASEIRHKNIQIAAASPEERSALNLQLGKLLSERARIDKLLTRLDSLSL